MKRAEDADRSVRVIVLLQTVAQAEKPITANEISDRTGLPKATVYRLCEQLLEARLIRRQLGGRGYLSGPALVDLAQSVLAGRSVYVARHAIIARVSRTVGETCNLVAPEGGGMVYWDRVETEWPLRLQLPIGTCVPFHATASGKMFLACLPRPQCDQFIEEIDLEAFTARTLTSTAALKRELQLIREQGYSLVDEEFIDGMTAVAVAVKDRKQRYVASLAIQAPSSRMSISVARSHAGLLTEAAAQLGAGIPESERPRMLVD